MQKKNFGHTSKRRKAMERRKMILTLLVMLVLALLLLVVALLTSKNTPAPSSSVSIPISVSSSVASVVSSSSSSAPVGEYDEPATPPLFNATHPIPENYQMDLVSVGNSQQMDAPAARAFTAMAQAAKEDGITLTPISGYRTHQRQTNNYNASIQRYMNEGKTKEEATRLTQDYYAIPGTSEHEAGLAVDIDSLEESFEKTPEFAWLQENAEKYGFILRYQRDTKEITRINYEPWHYRYVGTNHAAQINKLGVTLEEYVEGLATASQPTP